MVTLIWKLKQRRPRNKQAVNCWAPRKNVFKKTGILANMNNKLENIGHVVKNIAHHQEKISTIKFQKKKKFLYGGM